MRCLLAVASVSVLLLLPSPARAADVHGDDGRDVYVGTGGLVLPSSAGDVTRERVASCAGCRWRLTAVCDSAPPSAGSGFDGQHACTSVVRGCPGRSRTLRAWFQPGGGRWEDLGGVCIGEVTTVADVGLAVAAQVTEGVPGLRPSFRPGHGVVSQLPVAFSSGQPAGPKRWSMQVAGTTVEAVAVPTWTWSFGDGSSLTGADPGGRGLAVAHAYRKAGHLTVRVQTRWAATYRVDGLGPFPVAEPVVQTATVDVAVGEGRAVLVPG